MAFGQICLSGNRNTKHSGVTKQGHSTQLKGHCATAESAIGGAELLRHGAASGQRRNIISSSVCGQQD